VIGASRFHLQAEGSCLSCMVAMGFQHAKKLGSGLSGPYRDDDKTLWRRPNRCGLSRLGLSVASIGLDLRGLA